MKKESMITMDGHNIIRVLTADAAVVVGGYSLCQPHRLYKAEPLAESPWTGHAASVPYFIRELEARLRAQTRLRHRRHRAA